MSTIRQRTEDVIDRVLTLITQPREAAGPFLVETEYVGRGTVANKR